MITKQDILNRIELNRKVAEKELKDRAKYLEELKLARNARYNQAVGELSLRAEKVQRAKRRLDYLLLNKRTDFEAIEKQATKLATLIRELTKSDFSAGYEIGPADREVRRLNKRITDLADAQEFVKGLPHEEFSNALADKLGLTALFRYRG